MKTGTYKVKVGFDYTVYGYNDGKCIFDRLRNVEEHRRQLVLKAAKELQGHTGNTTQYLEGLEKGMKKSRATEATARRIRYEVAAIFAAYNITIELEVRGRVSGPNGKQLITNEQLDFRNLQAQDSWLGLVNTARKMRNAWINRKRLREGLPQQIGRGNHNVRKFNDTKFDKLREQLIERTAANQALDLLDAAIIAVTNAYLAVASEDIETLREAEKKIHDKVNGRNLERIAFSNRAKQRLQLIA